MRISLHVSRTSLNFQDEVEAEMMRLKQELKQTMEMYSTACKEALTAKQKVMSCGFDVLILLLHLIFHHTAIIIHNCEYSDNVQNIGQKLNIGTQKIQGNIP